MSMTYVNRSNCAFVNCVDLSSFLLIDIFVKLSSTDIKKLIEHLIFQINPILNLEV